MPKKDLVIAPPYLGMLSLQICTRINCIMKNKLPYCNICLFSRLNAKLVTYLHFKTTLYCFLCSGIVYNFQCGGWNATYYDKNKHHFTVRMCEHFLHLQGRVKGDDDSAIKEHILFCKSIWFWRSLNSRQQQE